MSSGDKEYLLVFKDIKKKSCIFAVGLAACLTLSYSVSAAEVEHITVLGDSISSGYGLSEDERNYGSWLGEYFDADVENFAVEGKTTQELIDSIETDENVSQSVENSDLICISIGANDILDIFYDDLISIASGFQVSQNRGNINISAETIEKLVVSFSTAMGPASVNAGENIGKIADMLLEINPDAKLVFQTVYNPFETNNDSERVWYTPLYTFTSIYLAAINNAVKKQDIFEFADIQKKFKGNCPIFTNIEKMDIHPNNLGHLLIAEEIVQELKITGENMLFKNGLNDIMIQNQDAFPEDIKNEINLLAQGQFREEDIKNTFGETKKTTEESIETKTEPETSNSKVSEKNKKNTSNQNKTIRLIIIIILSVLMIINLNKKKKR